jgi:hypothetical protein
MDLRTQARQIVSEFTSKEHLSETLKKSSYLPGFINGEFMTSDECIDGGTPYVFPFDIEKRKDEHYRTLYVKLSSFGLLREALSAKSDINVASRAVEGIQRVHDLLKTKHANKLVSFVEDWTITDYSMNSAGRFLWLIITYIVHLIVLMSSYFPVEVKQSPIYRRLTCLMKELWTDFGHRILN